MVEAAIPTFWPNMPLLEEDTACYDRARVALAMIAPLYFPQSLLQPPYKTPAAAWTLLKAQTWYAGLEAEAAPFFTWLRGQLHPLTARVDALLLVELEVAIED